MMFPPPDPSSKCVRPIPGETMGWGVWRDGFVLIRFYTLKRALNYYSATMKPFAVDL